MPPLLALQETPVVEIERPPPRYLRQDEDWSGLRVIDDSKLRWQDRIKFVPLKQDRSFYATFGGHARARLESWDGFVFQPNDDQLVLSRIVPYADLHLGQLRLFGELVTARVADRDLPGGARSQDQDSIDILQAFAEIPIGVGSGEPIDLRAGRETFDMGDGRLIGPAPFGRNIARSWNAISARTTVSDWNWTGFWGELVVPVDGDLNRARGDQFWGVYGTTNLEGSTSRADTYLLGREQPSVAYNGSAGNEERYTGGGRLYRDPARRQIDFDVEAAYQLGQVGSSDISAYMIAAEAGYSHDGDLAPRAWIGADHASGDRSPGGDVETFSQLFPRGHRHLGFIDVVGRQNILAMHIGMSIKLNKRLTLAAIAHTFRLSDSSDALYNAGGVPIIPAGSSTSRRVGDEIDLTVSTKFGSNTSVLLGYSHFFGGRLQRDAGLEETVRFFYLSLSYSL